jgi:hypothetical protein
VNTRATLTPTLSLAEGEGVFDPLAPGGGEGQGEGAQREHAFVK